jgi:hypothetical protein
MDPNYNNNNLGDDLVKLEEQKIKLEEDKKILEEQKTKLEKDKKILEEHKTELNTFKTNTLIPKGKKWLNATGTDTKNRLELLRIIDKQRNQRTDMNLIQYFDWSVIVYDRLGKDSPPYSEFLNFCCRREGKDGKEMISIPDGEMKKNSGNTKMIYWIDHVLIKCIESGINNIEKKNQTQRPL